MCSSVLSGVHLSSGVSHTLLVVAVTASWDTILADEKGIRFELGELANCVLGPICRGLVRGDLRRAAGGRTMYGVAIGVLFLVIL